MQAHDRSRPFRVAALAACAIVGAGAIGESACDNASHMFSGMWESEDVVDGDWIEGRPELALGHFGPELTGVVWFKDADGFAESCACAFVDQQDVDLGAHTFIASTTLCDGETRWLWSLTYNDEGADPRLVGDVRRAGDDASAAVAVSFVLDGDFVPDDRRECQQ